jgi:hypothetical protein
MHFYRKNDKNWFFIVFLIKKFCLGRPESSMGKHGGELKTSKTGSREKREALHDVLGRHDNAPYSRSSNRIVLGSDRSSEIPSVETERPETRGRSPSRDALGTAGSPLWEPTKKSQEAHQLSYSSDDERLKIHSISKMREEAAPRSSKQPGSRDQWWATTSRAGHSTG